MQNFDFLSPTRIIFGKDTIQKTGMEVSKYGKKALVVTGSGSIRRSGVYDTVTASLARAGVKYINFSGVQPNPRLSLVQEGIRICREQSIDFLLALGGGSVIDTAKAIGAGTLYDGDVWDFYAGKLLPVRTLPVGVVLTIAAAGSEASKSSVISNQELGLKRGLNCEIIRPVFAILDPELTYTLPAYQTACGVCDIMAHVMERYFTNETGVDLTDRLCESTLVSVIQNTYRVLSDPRDYNARAQLMWAGTLAHNDLLGTGRLGDFASHAIEHELSAINDVAHGAGLAIVFPAWMQFVYRHLPERFLQFAARVFQIDPNFMDPDESIRAGIDALRSFFRRIGLPVTLKEIGILPEQFPGIAKKCRKGPGGTVGNFVPLGEEEILKILHLAAE
ncbi:MAG TPA: NADH-dependent alcohol dehydrogenase [Clostridiales bacterium]|nr:NADH-dependent alcohol dehydrogenase [Clostridiales bacterium]